MVVKPLVEKENCADKITDNEGELVLVKLNISKKI